MREKDRKKKGEKNDDKEVLRNFLRPSSLKRSDIFRSIVIYFAAKPADWREDDRRREIDDILIYGAKMEIPTAAGYRDRGSRPARLRDAFIP